MKRRRLNLIHSMLIGVILIFLGTYTVQAGNLTKQQRQFERAVDALKAKKWKTFQRITKGLKDYPLYYYLRYHYLKPRLKNVRYSEIDAFFKRYGNTYFGDSLRQDWLKHLAKKAHWKTFVRVYKPQKSTYLQCHYVQARLKTKKNTRAAIADAKKLWMVGKLQPKSCIPVFNYLYKQKLINKTQFWKRIGLAMNKGQLKLADFLAKRLNSADRVWVKRWQTMHKRPAKTIARFNRSDSKIARKIILHGVRRLARNNFKSASKYWRKFQRRYSFSVEQIGEMQRDLALASVKHKHPDAMKWLTAVHKNYLNDNVSDIRIKLALKTENWSALADFITEQPYRDNLRLHYWLARAFEELGKKTQAQRIYKIIAKQRDYYGFLAADRVGAKYQMQHRPITFKRAEKAKLMKHPSIAGADEFYKLSQRQGGKSKWRINARHEWRYAIKHLSSHKQAIAAALASSWKWHDQAIMAAHKSGHHDDLMVRFPLAFRKQLTAGAKSQDIDLAWVYGIVRQESLFKTGAYSRVGAHGLMQLMPATARSVAKRIGIRIRRNKDILKIDTNIKLGTGYLRQMLDKFEGNHMLATAAYNAGPGRAKRWLNNNRCKSADIWVELIPFDETRNYVHRVLFYSRVFGFRLGQRKPRPLRVTLAPHDNCNLKYAKQEKKSKNSG